MNESTLIPWQETPQLSLYARAVCYTYMYVNIVNSLTSCRGVSADLHVWLIRIYRSFAKCNIRNGKLAGVYW